MSPIRPDPRVSLRALRIPAAAWGVALLVGLLHLLPVWRAQFETPPGWRFTGNLKASPDFMQYRVWARRTLQTGLLVDNTFTSEPNPPHLPVVYYAVVGRLAHWTDSSPELVDAYLGAVFAAALSLVLFATVRRFLPTPSQTWWVFGAILLGGGLGAHLKLLSALEFVRQSAMLRQLILDGLPAAHVFDDYRGAYVVTALFDTHYLLIWLITTLAVLCLYNTLREFSAPRVALTAAAFAAVTIVHVYEGVTLLLIALGVTVLCWRKRVAIRPAVLTLGACAAAVAIVFASLSTIYRVSGLPISPWRGANVPFSTLLLAYPLASGLLAWGISGYWRRAGLNECFLLGWALGGVVELMSGPFYPYAPRGAVTLQIPLFIVAAAIYFAARTRVTLAAALTALLLLGATPFNVFRYEWRGSRFNEHAPYMFLSPDHQALLGALLQHAHAEDVLLVDKSGVGRDELWLAPTFPGRHYCGHFFLTVDYKRKRAKAARFFRATAAEQAAFLQAEKIRFVFVAPTDKPDRFVQLPGLALLSANSAGALFEYTGAHG